MCEYGALQELEQAIAKFEEELQENNMLSAVVGPEQIAEVCKDLWKNAGQCFTYTSCNLWRMRHSETECKVLQSETECKDVVQVGG